MRLRVEAARAVREVLRVAAVLDQQPRVARGVAADDAVVGGRCRATPLRTVEVAAVVTRLLTRSTRHRVILRAGLFLRLRRRLVGDTACERERQSTRHESLRDDGHRHARDGTRGHRAHARKWLLRSIAVAYSMVPACCT